MADPEAPPRRPFLFQGRLFRLVEDPAVRDEDLRRGRLTVEAHPSGPRQVVETWQVHGPRPEGHAPPVEPFELRPLIEEILDAGFDDVWLSSIVSWVQRLRLLRLPERRE